MKRVRIAEFKRQLSRHLRAVERGEELEVTDRDRPIARVVPVRRRATVQLTEAELSPRVLRARRARPAGWDVDSLSLLLEDRRSR